MFIIFVLCVIQAVIVPAWHTREHVAAAKKLGIEEYRTAHTANYRQFPWFLRYAPFVGSRKIDARLMPQDVKSLKNYVYLEGNRSAVALYCLAIYIGVDRLLHLTYGFSPVTDMIVTLAAFALAVMMWHYKIEVCVFVLVPLGAVFYIVMILVVGHTLRHPKFIFEILSSHPFPLLFGMAICFGIAIAGMVPWPWPGTNSRGEEVWHGVLCWLSPRMGEWMTGTVRGASIPLFIGGSILSAVLIG